jgi:hypothetical protein
MNAQLPLYQCHKRVRAAKINQISFAVDAPRCVLVLGSPEDRSGIVEVSADWIREKRAEVGGYYVEYDDGYTSYSPAKAFEDGYTPVAEQ